jgi:hypothetical protein
VTGPSQTDPQRAATAAVAVRIEDDPPPVVRALANDLRARVSDPAFAEATATTHGTVVVGDAETPQSATLRIDEHGVLISHGAADAADLRATVDLRGDGPPTLEGEGEHPALGEWLRDLLSAPLPAWPEAAARFWAVLATMPGAPEALLVVELPGGEQRRYGAPNGRAYELYGSAAGLAEVLGGRTPLVEAAFAGKVFVRGTFPQLSVLSGAGFRIRYGTGDEAGADA